MRIKPTTIKRISILLSLFLALSLFLSPVAYCSATYTITEEQLNSFEMELNQLEMNNERLLTLLGESRVDLEEAENISENLRLESLTLKSQLEESRTTVTLLRKQLEELRVETKNAKESLETANKELEIYGKLLKEQEKQRDRTESRLRAQRNIWEAIAVIAVGVAAHQSIN